ncbi:cysteine--tRNA ligase, partial [bacterium]|nr:cysteine--tRNA ligase [bacterium]
MALTFHNTMARRKEEFVPLEEGEVRMYTCGPTVYDNAHIGNFRSYIFEDILRRYLKYRGYRVIQVMNLTDVDDKTIRDSRKGGISLAEHTEKYIRAFFEDIDTLHIERAEFYPRATEHVAEMIEIVSGLLEKDYAYKGEDGSIYYRIDKFEDYGKLAHISPDLLRPGVTVNTDEYDKESVGDFALWKAWDEEDGDVFWESPFGKGRPGWHIECSAMSMKYLGETFDIHTGGVDNIFPHHDNEIAQSEAYTGKQFVRYWLHAAHLIVEGRKMSKSLGNFYTLRDLLGKGYTGRQIRYLLMSCHYRQQLNFTFEGLESAKNGLQRIDDFLAKLDDADSSEGAGDVAERIEMARQSFTSALDDDLNISGA